MHSAPYWLIKAMCASHFKTLLPPPLYSADTPKIAARYVALMAQRPSIIEVAILNGMRHFSIPLHSMHETDRMMNPAINFPIAFCYGDRDFFGSDGADAIV